MPGLVDSGHPRPEKVMYGDGSWQLSVFVTDLQVERNIRVKGDLHIGGVMIQLVDSLGNLLIHIHLCILFNAF